MNRTSLVCAAALCALACSSSKEVGGGFSNPVGIRMEATAGTPAFEMAVAANSKEFPPELVSPLSSAVVKALKACPPPSVQIVALNLAVDEGAISELAGAPVDEQAKCLVEAMKKEKLPAGATPHLQLLAQLRFGKVEAAPAAAARDAGPASAAK